MIDEKLLKNLSNDEKEQLMGTLNTLISQTYVVEKEYKTLRDSYDKLSNVINQIIESMPNAIWVLDRDGEIFLQNSKAQALRDILERVEIRESDEEVEFDDEIYLISIRQNEAKFIISATKITEQKRADRLVSMGQVAAHLAHEIRNPIGSISLLTSTLLKKVPTTQKPIVFEIKKAIFRVERIIKSTLLFTKGVKIDKEPTSLLVLREELEEAYENYTFTKEIALEIAFDEEREIALDLDTFAIVLQNFLYNGIDAIEEDETSESGVVRFEYREDDRSAKITIKDSGVAIKDESILYEPFKTTKLKGHGLGLALSKEIVEAHGGKIELLKEEKGFVITLPKGVKS